MVTPLRQHPPPVTKPSGVKKFHSWLYLLLPDIPTLPARETSLTFIVSVFGFVNSMTSFTLNLEALYISGNSEAGTGVEVSCS